nr:GTP-binding protein [uncultured Acidocella sp.]
MSIPVTILGGFLGAGKTTALNHMLRHATQRIAVLVNDFGALNIDATLLQGADNLVPLANGCVCCSIGLDFSATLSEVVALAPERIVVEASGVSDPWRIAQLVKLNRLARLEAVIVLADALNVTAQHKDRWLSDTLDRQIARADLVALNKCDLADAPTLAAAQATLQAIRPGVSVLQIAHGALPNALLLPARMETASALIADAPEHGISSWSWQSLGRFDEMRLCACLDALPASIWRGKGTLRLADGRVLLLQLVGRRWSLEAFAGEASALVLLGTPDMPAPEALTAAFAAALAP